MDQGAGGRTRPHLGHPAVVLRQELQVQGLAQTGRRGPGAPASPEFCPMLAQVSRWGGAAARGAIIVASPMDEPIDPAFLRDSELFENQPAEVDPGRPRPGTAARVRPGRRGLPPGRRGRPALRREERCPRGRRRAGRRRRARARRLPRARARCIGELALLTGSPRSATVRSPEHAELFAVEKAVFLDLMDVLPAFSRNLCVVLAKRLEATTLKVPRAAGKQLQGNLRYFDLATVIQTLIGSHQTGALVVSQDKHKLAEIFFYRGNIARAKLPAARRATTPSSSSSRAPIEGEFSFTGREVRGGRGAERDQHARDLAAHGVGAPAGRAAAAQGEAARPRAGVPAEGGPPLVGGPRHDRARGRGLVAPQEGREPQRPAARRAALLVRDLPDGLAPRSSRARSSSPGRVAFPPPRRSRRAPPRRAAPACRAGVRAASPRG